MSTHTNLEALIEAAKSLSAEDRLRLLQALFPQTEPSAQSRHRITEMRGLGKEVWKGIDAQRYVDMERDSWET
jgi:phenylalanyl-tRNA synthetase alpha subunit